MQSVRFQIWLGLFLIWSAASLSLFGSDDGLKARIKKRVSVFVFEDKTNNSWHWWDRRSLGEGISDIITAELRKMGNYSIIRAQEPAAAHAEKPDTVAPGDAVDVELAIYGTVTEFGYEKDNRSGRLRDFGIDIHSRTATVALECRMVNGRSGEIVGVEKVRKQRSSQGIRVDTWSIKFESRKAFDESLVGKATRDAVREVLRLVDKNAVLVDWQAKVVEQKNGHVYIDAGSQCGIKAGDQFVVYHKGEELINPDTGSSLGSMDNKIGKIKVSKADLDGGKASECRILEGSGFQSGDLVRLE
ncbi:hypothetical protein GWO43_09790 [candidate division KSB1 bacterium]|nr:hypothetical protein [candidate division KSB1 bacterium]NIR72286.1 hypothetical protein [candidate division KSB1 bacterium]NIS24257.1 hypothetical protein [candidate division KSB1 bacterium]NIT71172.1 hypothetical protein [candidate division KSB1 bacterium]NIU24876.1 hypothetical protein [candidate division KSB1 bacterium]